VAAGSQERLKRELLAFVVEMSREAPLVLFLDDVHWADVSTVDLLAYVGIRCNTLRVLLLITYRPADLLQSRHAFVRVKQELEGRGVCREVSVEFLTRSDIEQYVGIVYPEHFFPPQFPELLQARTEGSPLFLADLLRYLRDREVIVREKDHWTLKKSVQEIKSVMPDSVGSMIQKKIDQLDEKDRRLLTAASVQGFAFDAAVVARALALDAAEVEDRLDALERVHGFVRVSREQEFPDRTLTLRYHFVHVLYQNALYASLRPTRRAALSAAVAEALLGHYGEKSPTVAGELALLFEAARDFERAIHWNGQASEQATRLFAYREAVALARRGLHLVSMMPDSPARAEQELALQILLGPALMNTTGWGSPEVKATYLRAQVLCTQVGDTPQFGRVLWGLWYFHLLRAEIQTAITLEEGEDLAAVTLTDPRGEMAMGSAGPERWPVPKVTFENVFVRGKGHLLAVKGSRPFELEVKNAVAALDAAAIDIDPSTADPSAAGSGVVRLSRVTAYLGAGLVHLRAAERRTDTAPAGLARTEVQAGHCLFVPAAGEAEPLVRTERLADREQVDRWFGWRGEENVYGYDKKKGLLEYRPSDAQSPVRLGGEDWLTLTAEKGDPFAAVGFPGRGGLPEAGQGRKFVLARPGQFQARKTRFEPPRPEGAPEVGAADVPGPHE
jgi:hypothetical protein